jgi:hypothetical protein
MTSTGELRTILVEFQPRPSTDEQPDLDDTNEGDRGYALPLQDLLQMYPLDHARLCSLI